MAVARSNPGESSGTWCLGPANRSHRSEENSVSVLERSESLTRVKGVDAAPDACKLKPRGEKWGGGSVHDTKGRRERGDPTAWARRVEEGAVRAVGRGAVLVEAVTGRATQGRVCGGKGVRHVCWLLGRSLGPTRDEQRRFVIIQKYSNGLN
jgi:hypothetical protein